VDGMKENSARSLGATIVTVEVFRIKLMIVCFWHVVLRVNVSSLVCAYSNGVPTRETYGSSVLAKRAM
jgi:hypothetical protein